MNATPWQRPGAENDRPAGAPPVPSPTDQPVAGGKVMPPAQPAPPPAGEKREAPAQRPMPPGQAPTGERRETPAQPATGERRETPGQPSPGERREVPAQPATGERREAPAQPVAGERREAPLPAPSGSATDPRKDDPRTGDAGNAQRGRQREPGAEPNRSLVGSKDAEGFRRRWHDVQGTFVDDPSAAVRQADELAAEVLGKLTDALAARKKDLDGRWQDEDASSDTERLRQAMRGYRSFVEEILPPVAR